METASTTFWVVVKNLAYIPMAFLGLSHENYTILAVLMVIDTVTGLIRSGIVHGTKTITSKNLSIGILSKLSLITIPLVIALAGKGVGLQITWLAKSALSMLILSECYSILGNIQSIRIKQDVHEFDAVNFVLEKVRNILEKTLRK